MKRAASAQKRGVIAVDVDGVVADTAYECYIQSIKTWVEVGGKLKHSPEVQRQFLAARPLITKREHFFTVLKMIEENPRINFNFVTQEQMNARFKANAKAAEPFSQKYLINREAMMKADRPAWRKLNPSFPKIVEFINRARQYGDVYIATTKDRASVFELLRHYRISLTGNPKNPIPEDRVIAVDFSKDKGEQLKEIARRSGRPINKVILVDDAIEQIKRAHEVGAKGLLYSRGYSTLRQKKEARKMGVSEIDFKKKFDARRLKNLMR